MEFDDQEWEKREWVKIYEDFQLFLLEYQLVWAKKKEGPGVGGACGGTEGMIQGTKAKHIQWPALVRVVYIAIYIDILMATFKVKMSLNELMCLHPEVIIPFFWSYSWIKG